MSSAVTQLRWIASSSTSALHAAHALALERPLVDPAWQEALQQPARSLGQIVTAYGTQAEVLWRHLLGLSAGVESNRQLAQVALRKARGAVPDRDVNALAGSIADIEAAVRRAQPKLADELVLRSEPLRQQWEARGPGMLHWMTRNVDAHLLPEHADVLLVHPVLGGGGAAHLLYNSVRIEAVLANPHASLPEIVRLAWLVAQLNQDLPVFSEQITPADLHRLASLALLPMTLAAAEHVELARCDLESIAEALVVWQPERTSVELADLLLDWWQTYQETRPAWSVALRGLDHMLRDAASQAGELPIDDGTDTREAPS